MKRLTPLRAIRLHCLSCADRPKFVRECPSAESCVLYQYRMGHNFARKGIGPKKGYAKPNPYSILSNSVRVFERFPEGTKARKDIAISKSRSLNQVAAGGEIGLIKMEAVGKVQMLDKKIIIEW